MIVISPSDTTLRRGAAEPPTYTAGTDEQTIDATAVGWLTGKRIEILWRTAGARVEARSLNPHWRAASVGARFARQGGE